MELELKIPPFSKYIFFSLPFLFVCGGLDLKEVASLIEGGAYTSEVQKIYRAMRLTMKLRSKLKASVLSAFLNYVLISGSEFHKRLSSYLPRVNY